MRLAVALISCVCAANIAWAGDEPAPSTTATPPSTAPATPAADTAKTTSTVHPTSSTTVIVTAEKEKKWRAEGYKPEKRGDATMWCRREATIGSRFEEKKCWTADVLEANERNSKEFAEDLQHTSNMNGK
jgi:hypothetical protein